MLAQRFPSPDVASRVRKLPTRTTVLDTITSPTSTGTESDAAAPRPATPRRYRRVPSHRLRHPDPLCHAARSSSRSPRTITRFGSQWTAPRVKSYGSPRTCSGMRSPMGTRLRSSTGRSAFFSTSWPRTSSRRRASPARAERAHQTLATSPRRSSARSGYAMGDDARSSERTDDDAPSAASSSSITSSLTASAARPRATISSCAAGPTTATRPICSSVRVGSAATMSLVPERPRSFRNDLARATRRSLHEPWPRGGKGDGRDGAAMSRSAEGVARALMTRPSRFPGPITRDSIEQGPADGPASPLPERSTPWWLSP
jgi:hypothetical protein